MTATAQTSSTQSIISQISNMATKVMMDGVKLLETNRFAQVGVGIGGLLTVRGMIYKCRMQKHIQTVVLTI